MTKEDFLSVFSKVRVNACDSAALRLDRFSQYQFGLFDDTKIHGVPASGVRFGELAMLRGFGTRSTSSNSTASTCFSKGRLAAIAMRRGWLPGKPCSGAIRGSEWWGLARPSACGRHGTRYPRWDIGKSFLPERYRNNGSVVVQIMLLKPL